MAEERILIRHYSNECRYMRVVSCDILKEEGLSNGTYCSAYIHGNWQKIDPEKDCKNCKRAEYDGMSRTEAIERMGRELCENVYGSFWENASEQEKQNSLIYAKAALDSLLKGGK